MSRLCFCFGGYVLGLVLAQYLDPPALPLLIFYPLLFVLLLVGHRFRFSNSGLILFCLLSGLIRYHSQLAVPENHALDQMQGRGGIRIVGQVLSTHERPNQGLVINLSLQAAGERAISPKAEERLRLYIKRADAAPAVGSRLVFRSVIRRTRNFGVPGEFDYVQHLAYQRIWHTAYLQDPRGLAVFPAEESSLHAKIDLIRKAGFSLLEENFPLGDSILLKGLLLGEKGGMPKTLKRKLAAGGVSHLFAISGLHLGLLAFLIYAFLKYLYSRSSCLLLWQPASRVLWFIILPLLFFYLLLTGDALATRRAFYGVLVVALLFLLRRRTDPLNMLMMLAFLFLLIEPLALWQPSFLLSFSGVLGILLWQKKLQLMSLEIPRLPRYLIQLFCVSLAAFIATLPAVVYIFHMLAPAGLLTNLLAIPLVSLVGLPAGLIGLLLSMSGLSAGLIFLKISVWAMQSVVTISNWTADLPGFYSRAVFLSLPETIAILLCCLSVLFCLRHKKALLLLMPAVMLFGYTPSAGADPELIVFSVGQGEAMLLRSEGRNVLIDGGGLRSDVFDVGERLLAPALGRMGIQTLDAVVLTHNHPDHSRGLDYIMANFQVREFWSPLDIQNLRPELVRLMSENGVQIKIHRTTGWSPAPVGGISSVRLFNAPADVLGENNRSLGLYLPTAAGGVLLTGDLEAPGVEALLALLPGKVGLLKAPHHGSAGSRPIALLEQLQPGVIVVSAGYKNPYRLPSRVLLDQARKQEVRVWRTDLDGSIRLGVDGEMWRVKHWFRGLFR